MIDLNKPVRTKQGEAVEIVTTKGRGKYPVIGYKNGSTEVSTWMIDGKFQHGGTGKLDLENIPELEAPEEIRMAFIEGYLAGFNVGRNTHSKVNEKDYWLDSLSRKNNLGKKVVDEA